MLLVECALMAVINPNALMNVWRSCPHTLAVYHVTGGRRSGVAGEDEGAGRGYEEGRDDDDNNR